MIRKLNKKTSQLQGTFIAGYGGETVQRPKVTLDPAPPRPRSKPKKRKEPLW